MAPLRTHHYIAMLILVLVFILGTYWINPNQAVVYLVLWLTGICTSLSIWCTIRALMKAKASGKALHCILTLLPSHPMAAYSVYDTNQDLKSFTNPRVCYKTAFKRMTLYYARSQFRDETNTMPLHTDLIEKIYAENTALLCLNQCNHECEECILWKLMDLERRSRTNNWV
eukprot:24548_1